MPRMGLDLALAAWRELPDGILVVAGEGPERPRLERMARDLGIAQRVRFAGRVEEPSLPDLYRAADVIPCPRCGLEGFGLACALESLACAPPVIASDADGLPEALAGLGHDLVVPRGHERALRERLEGAFSGRSPAPAATAGRTPAFQGVAAAHPETLHTSATSSAASGRPPPGPSAGRRLGESRAGAYVAARPGAGAYGRRRSRVPGSLRSALGGELALARIIEALPTSSRT